MKKTDIKVGDTHHNGTDKLVADRKNYRERRLFEITEKSPYSWAKPQLWAKYIEVRKGDRLIFQPKEQICTLSSYASWAKGIVQS
ncbi:hypothetical protein SD70_29605 [Gordoniibacillus kamchatkensis]|uniref:Uncharacterized protein n=1 Tax=Gordoniibacillus kamchatkensis TaxID=1590651 RepID=A0ABR5AAB4_9BACL|nr:hypothetical protein [Paenibacillus sp. VKM B-2647]KIL37948.1 hypothetical protein SD70_29605 [Paenibacillus sp. VKM B-2647]